MKSSSYLQCPLTKDFFTKLDKAHSSEIRRKLRQSWKLKGNIYREVLRDRLLNFGSLQVTQEKTDDFAGAFRYAENWNGYYGWKLDKNHLEEALGKQWELVKGELILDVQTCLTVASLSFEKDSEKESPNHFFLKELFRLFVNKHYTVHSITEEEPISVYNEKVRCDLVCCVNTINSVNSDELMCIVCEVGGVQLWKVLALLFKGYDVMIMPHWTRQKVNPFNRIKLNYEYYTFRQRR